MTWNNRLIIHKDGDGETYMAIHEVFYEDDGTPIGCTADPIEVMGADRAECLESYKMMAEAFDMPAIHEEYFKALEIKNKGFENILRDMEAQD